MIRKALSVNTVSRSIDRIDVLFDDPNAVGNAGLILAATLIRRLGLEALINERVRLDGREGGSRPGRKVLTLVCAIIAGPPTSITSTSCALGQPSECWASG